MTDGQRNWELLSDDYALPPDQVHVLRARLDLTAGFIAELYQTLSSDERERAAKFHLLPDRARHVVGRGLSRVFLGACLGVPADCLRFEYNPDGKPMLAKDFQHSLLNFNVSHSGDFILVALAYDHDVGVDIELIRTDFDVDEIAKQFFSESECSSLTAQVSADKKHEAFFTCWTRKEAYQKACGVGLNLPLNAFDLAFLPGQQPRLIETRHDPAEARRWTLRDLDVGPGYKAAIAVEGNELQLKTWDWFGHYLNR
jgi:4'-phosphopantetheinyl transferase